MKHFAPSFLIAIAAVTIAPEIAQASPLWDAQGEYNQFPANASQQTRVYRAVTIVEGDPTGTNCRISQDSIGSQGGRPNPQYDINQWPILLAIPSGTPLTASVSFSRYGNPIQAVLRDVNGKHWMAVETYKGSCFVRAHKHYIEPVESSAFPYRDGR